MKFSHKSIAGVAVAVIAATTTATAVALKKKSSKVKKAFAPLIEYTALEREKLSEWPVKFATKTLKDGQHSLLPATTSEMDENSAETPAMETDQEDSPKTVIGDGPGQLKPFSPAYRKLIAEIRNDAVADDAVTLELYGKTYGLGARGHKIVDAALPGTLYDASDIEKLYNKAQS